MTNCNYCGAENSTDKFCIKCGSALSPDTTNPSASAKGSSRAMWAHLGPLLLAASSFLLGLVLGGLQSTVPEDGLIGTPLGLQILQLVPLLVLWVPPLIIRVSSRSNAFEKRHASTSLNNQISLFLYIVTLVIIFTFSSVATFTKSSNFSLSGLAEGFMIIATMFTVLGVLGLISLISSIVGSVAGSSGKEYRYPIAIRFMK